MTRDEMSLIIAKFNRLKKNSNRLEYINKRVIGGYQKLIDQKLLQPELNFHFRKLFEFRYWLKHSEEEGFIDT